LVFRSSFLYLVFGAQTLSRFPSQHSRSAPFELPECTTPIAWSILGGTEGSNSLLFATQSLSSRILCSDTENCRVFVEFARF
jgi:hypothetical protein